MSARQTRQSRIDSWTNSIQEDSLLEDMCQMADIEFDGDATHMTDKAKSKMLKRLSRAPQTENLFKSERALSEFVARYDFYYSFNSYWQILENSSKSRSSSFLENSSLKFYQSNLDAFPKTGLF